MVSHEPANSRIKSTSMHAISSALGLRTRAGMRLESLRNRDVYSLAAELLGIGSVSEELRAMVI